MMALQKELFMAGTAQHALPTLSIDEASARGLVPLTIAENLDSSLPVGDGTHSMRYIEWLTTEQQRIKQDRNRQAEIVDEGEGRVSLWVDAVATP
jgi:hypothetical protein